MLEFLSHEKLEVYDSLSSEHTLGLEKCVYQHIQQSTNNLFHQVSNNQLEKDICFYKEILKESHLTNEGQAFEKQ